MLKIAQKNINFSSSHAQILDNIIIDYNDFNKKDLSKIVQTAYGQSGYGVLFVKNVPNYAQCRNKTLPLNWKIAQLPQEVLKKYTINCIPHRGWHLVNPDNNPVASFYFNATQDHPVQIKPQHQKIFTQKQLQSEPSNVWVDELPQFQKNTKQLCKIITGTASLLAREIDRYVLKILPQYEKNFMTRVADSGYHTGRSLHYFHYEEKGKMEGDWIWWHNDFGNFTGLTSPMYIDQNGNQVQEPEDGGLYAKNRSKLRIKIKIPNDMIAYQIGQSTQITTGGKLVATPHCVIKSPKLKGKHVSRQSLAVFMDPNLTDQIKVPQGTLQSDVISVSEQIGVSLKGRWKNGMMYKQLLHNSLKMYHDDGYKQKEIN